MLALKRGFLIEIFWALVLTALTTYAFYFLCDFLFFELNRKQLQFTIMLALVTLLVTSAPRLNIFNLAFFNSILIVVANILRNNFFYKFISIGFIVNSLILLLSLVFDGSAFSVKRLIFFYFASFFFICLIFAKSLKGE